MEKEYICGACGKDLKENYCENCFGTMEKEKKAYVYHAENNYDFREAERLGNVDLSVADLVYSLKDLQDELNDEMLSLSNSWIYFA